MRTRNDEAGTRLPIKVDSTSNGEFAPVPLEPVHEYANALAHERAAVYAKRQGFTRRQFLVSACGAATTLLAMNSAYATIGRTGGHFALPDDATMDADAALDALGKKEFIFDVQGHFVNPEGKWLTRLPPDARPLSGFEHAGCALAKGPGERAYLDCFGPDAFVKDVFMDSDTDMMVLSFVPSTREGEPLTIEEAAATRDIVERLEGTQRLMLHGRVNPNQPGDIEDMERLAAGYGISAWKTYTQWGPDGAGFWMTDDVGLAFIEKARALGVKNIAIHKGIPFGQRSYEHSLCDDVGRVAKMFPDINFLIYHAGYVPNQPERAFDASHNDGIDSLVKTFVENGLERNNSNVYAELGSTWRFLMRDPDSAAHGLGKLVKYLGENQVLWGTDSIWYGSPQDQILAFRTFQISDEYQDRYGYQAITPEIRAKIFGVNAMKPYGISIEEMRKRTTHDRIAADRAAYAVEPDPHYLTFGPKTRREFLNLLGWSGPGAPG